MKPRIGIIGGGTFGTMHLRTATQAHARGEIERDEYLRIREDLT